MTKELKEITKKIDKEFINYFYFDMNMETIFVVGSMANDKYQDRQDNDYDIRVICKEVNSIKINNFEKFLEEICKKLTTDTIEVGCSCLIGPVNHKVSNNKKNILIHSTIYTEDQIENNLPKTHKYQYASNYRIVYGKDILKKYKNVRYNMDELINSYECLNYCIDMLKNREYRYFVWDTKNDKCEFNYYKAPMSEDMIIKSCCYSVNMFIDNLMTYCKWEKYDIPENKMIFTIRLLEKSYVNENTLFLLQGLFTENESILKAIFNNPLKETIKLLEELKENIKKLNNIFRKKEDKKNKILSKYKNYLLRI